jgi:hypothetical protein
MSSFSESVKIFTITIITGEQKSTRSGKTFRAVEEDFISKYYDLKMQDEAGEGFSAGRFKRLVFSSFPSSSLGRPFLAQAQLSPLFAIYDSAFFMRR